MKTMLKQRKPAGQPWRRPVQLAGVERVALVHLISCGTALSNIVHNIRHDPRAGKWKQACQRWQLEWDNALTTAQMTIGKLRADGRMNGR